MTEQERAPGERRIGEHRVGRLLGVRRHDRVVVGAARAYEHVLQVEGDRLRALQRCTLRVDLAQVLLVVEFGFGRQRDVPCASGFHDLGESGAGDEADPVSALDEVPRGGQERSDVPVDGHGGDEERTP